MSEKPPALPLSSSDAQARLRELLGTEPLSADIGVPLHVQIGQRLHRLVASGKLAPGELVPTELELMRHFRVGRGTVRAAFESLVAAGLVVRCRGRGTEIAPPKWAIEVGSPQSFSEAIARAGGTTYARVLDWSRREADELVAARLEVEPAAAVWHLERLRFIDDLLAAHSETWLSAHVQLAVAPRASDSLWQLLRVADLAVVSTASRIEVVPADAALAGRLRVATGTPLLRETTVARARDEVPIEFTIAHYRGDRFVLVAGHDRASPHFP